MTISWMTRDKIIPSAVYYGLHPFSIEKIALAKTDAQSFKEADITRFMHRVTLQNLRPALTYCTSIFFITLLTFLYFENLTPNFLKCQTDLTLQLQFV